MTVLTKLLHMRLIPLGAGDLPLWGQWSQALA